METKSKSMMSSPRGRLNSWKKKYLGYLCGCLITGHQPDEKNAPALQRGFTLIELLVAIVILAIGILGVVALFPQSYSHVGNAGRLSIMNHLGQQKLDELKTLGYSHTDLVAGTHPSTPPERFNYVDADGNNIYENYTITWEVRDNKPTNKMKTVIVEVGHQVWDSSNNQIDASNAMNQKKVYFQTYISE